MTATMAANEVRERPILFSGEMVRAILDGRKTQTRRVVKLPRQATFENCAVRTWDADAEKLRAIAPEPPDIAPFLLGKRIDGEYLVCNLIDDVGLARVHCPYGQPGDRLWIRESHVYVGDGGGLFGPDRVGVLYLADESRRWLDGPGEDLLGEIVCNDQRPDAWKQRPSIHMPRWASRLTLEITNVRVERVQAITEDDAYDEGCEGHESEPRIDGEGEWARGHRTTSRDQYRALWDSLNAKRGHGWDVNPWVWVLEFRRAN